MGEIVQPLYIQVHERDNVAIIVNPEGLPAGSSFPNGLTLIDRIPQSHKVALRDLDQGDPILRYGQIIGHASRPLKAGSWVHEDAVELHRPPALDELLLATATPPPQPRLTGYTFEGFRNANGSAGTKNILGITTTVQCVAPTVEFAVQRIKQEILPRFPTVDDGVALTHPYGCGIAMDAPNADIPIQTIKHISTHANLGAAPLIVSLGCEKMQPTKLFPDHDFSQLPILESDPFLIRMQDELGFAETISAILRAAEKRLEQLARRQRTTIPASELCVGLQCGGSDAFSGVTCNPAVGFAADLLVRAGATVMFSEVTEVRDAVHLLTPRAINQEVARALIREMEWYDDYLSSGFADRSANPTPGNKRGGLTNVVEKSLGAPSPNPAPPP
jgi:galactarate dehydratase